MFTAQTYVDRRARLQAQLGSGLLLFLGNDESPINYAATTYPFRQDSTFLYFFGLDRPGCAALMDLDEGRTVVFGDDLTLDDIVWTGTQPTVAELALRAGVNETAPIRELEGRLRRAQGRSVQYLPPYRAEHRLKLAALLGLAPGQADGGASVPFIRGVVELRAVKSAEETVELEQAVDVTVAMHLAAMRMARPGAREAEIAAKVTEIALAAGGGLAYPVIATVHGETLHNPHYDNTLQAGQMFLLDAGAQTPSRYAGDLTSTCPVDRSFSARQRDVYEVVLRAHLGAIDQLRPGVPFREVHLAACRTLAEGMKELGLMKGDLGEAVEQGAHAMFFQCGLGHMMGLDVHDMESLGEVWVGYEGRPKSTQFGLKSLRLARRLQPGFVLTVEPGIYFIPQLIQRWKAEGRCTAFIDYQRLEHYADFGGIRIEENVLITEGGSRILGKARPRTAEEIAAARMDG
ncbi:MAG: aminopeptidase P family protein [Holophaga sp.]|jgi:Xaa-Pro aminopeptidase